jgi:predicted RNA-binding protein YlqC (UPF0109 family)
VFIVVIYFVIDSVRKLLDTPSYVSDRWTGNRFINYDVAVAEEDSEKFMPYSERKGHALNDSTI